MQPKNGRDSTRRNRNIGTGKQGHGQNNRLVIPFKNHPIPTFYFENLHNYQSIKRDIEIGVTVTFLVEETREDCFHACTVDDISYLLRFVPPADLEELDLIVLRQPKRKEEVLNTAWGRWVRYVEIDKHEGSAIFLEATSLSTPFHWSKSLSPDWQRELERLRDDGHKITTTKREYEISISLESVRATQLYRTLLHDIGHHVDYFNDCDAFDKKPSSERERFAHRYADELRLELTRRGIIPFGRMCSIEMLEQNRLRPADFIAIR
jgi:hypothetical protein